MAQKPDFTLALMPYSGICRLCGQESKGASSCNRYCFSDLSVWNDCQFDVIRKQPLV